MPECSHRAVITARNVTAIVRNGFLTSWEAMDPKDRGKFQPVKYEELVYCSSPTCEKVFAATRKEEED